MMKDIEKYEKHDIFTGKYSSYSTDVSFLTGITVCITHLHVSKSKIVDFDNISSPSQNNASTLL